MGIYYKNLDGECRQFMLEEFNKDATAGTLYISPRLNEVGLKNFWKNFF